MCPTSDRPAEYNLEGSLSQEAKLRTNGKLATVLQQFYGMFSGASSSSACTPSHVYWSSDTRSMHTPPRFPLLHARKTLQFSTIPRCIHSKTVFYMVYPGEC